jgi:hypothetical protein
MNVYYTGFAMQVDAVLQVAGADLDPALLTVTAALVKPDRSGLAPGSTIVTCTKPGGYDVRATWSAAQTQAMTPGHYEVEFRTSDGPFCHEGIRIELRAGVSS